MPPFPSALICTISVQRYPTSLSPNLIFGKFLGRSWNNESTGETTYRGQLEDINRLIANMVPGVIGQGDFVDIMDPYNFQQARNLTNDTVRPEGGKGMSGMDLSGLGIVVTLLLLRV